MFDSPDSCAPRRVKSPHTAASSTAAASCALDGDRELAVLLVDDETEVLETLGELLGNSYTVYPCESAAAALDIAERTQLDLIILDVNMPQLDGFQLCSRLKAMEATRQVPVIFITACDGIENELRALDGGAIDFLIKPCSPSRFLGRVHNHMAHARERRLLAARTIRDELTGLSNRYFMREALEREWQAALRNGTPVSAIFLDVDDFKAFNDRYGHPMGDECLRQVAKAVRSRVHRPYDVVARYGGEEFLVLLPGADHQDASNTAESIRQAVEALRLSQEGPGEPLKVTASLGVACHRPRWLGTVPDIDCWQLVELADKQLYRAKSQGKNRVCVARDEEPGASGL